jgi:hypothetical protein
MFDVSPAEKRHFFGECQGCPLSAGTAPNRGNSALRAETAWHSTSGQTVSIRSADPLACIFHTLAFFLKP